MLNNNQYSEKNQKDSIINTSVRNIIEQKFINERKIFLWGPINDKSAMLITEQILYLESINNKSIKFYINTPGGSISAGMAIYDTMKLIKSKITIIVTGIAASMGSILLCAASKGQRLLFPNARVLIHQPLIMGEFYAHAIDLNIQAQEIEKQREELNKILSDASGQSIEKIRKDTDRDFYMNAIESIDYGMADKIITSHKEL